MSLHIAVNTRLLLAGRMEGIGRFAHEILHRLPELLPGARFTFLFDRPYDPSFVYSDRVRPVVLFPPARHPVLYVAWFEGSVAHWLNRHSPDVFFSPDAYLSLRARVPQVPVFHDLAFEHFPQDIDWLHRRHYRNFFPRYARRAAHVLTVSECTRDDLIATYGLAAERITVAHNGSAGVFRPSSPSDQDKIREQFSDGMPYFLSVGAIQPRKNLPLLLRGFDRFKAETGHPSLLLLTGRKAWRTSETLATYEAMAHRDAVRFTGFVPDAELNGLYGSALALCYPSRFEGFGLPVLEALYAEAPVIAARASSLPEVGGDAALYVGPDDVAGMAAALERIATEPQLREILITKGREQRTLFSWERSAATVADVLQRVGKRELF